LAVQISTVENIIAILERENQGEIALGLGESSHVMMY
jgi:hypothetical protein